MAASPGYYRVNSQAEYSMPCYNSEACVGGSREQPLGECAEGYKGLACSRCLNNYFKATWKSCSSCLSNRYEMILGGFRFVFLAAMVQFIVSLSINISRSHNP